MYHNKVKVGKELETRGGNARGPAHRKAKGGEGWKPGN